MGTEENKELIRREIEEVWNRGNLDLADALFAATYVSHNPGNPGQAPGPRGVKDYVASSRAAWPDLHFTVEAQIAEGDLVATRWTVRGTHQREIAGVRPTGRQVSVTGTSNYRIAGGMIVEEWADWDELGVLKQIGAIPAPAQEANKALFRRYIEAINHQDHATLDEVATPEAARRTKEEIIPFVYDTFGPHHHIAIVDLIGEGDKVWARLATSGGHVKEWLGIPPTGIEWTNTVIAFVRVADGKIVEGDNLPDIWNHVTQLGATLTPPRSAVTAS